VPNCQHADAEEGQEPARSKSALNQRERGAAKEAACREMPNLLYGMASLAGGGDYSSARIAIGKLAPP